MIVDILKWNPINSNNFSADIKPSIYIKPTIELLDIFKRAPLHKMLVRILNTNSKYDNVITFSILDKSSDVPNKRDNLFDCNGLYVVTLGGLDWQGYPENNGKIEFLEGMVEESIKYLNSKTDTKENFEDPTLIPTPASRSRTTPPAPTPASRTTPPSPTPNPKKHGMNTNLLIMLGLLFLTVIFFMIVTNKSVNNYVNKEGRSKH